jgi:predicted amidophosphoribosyltransferase
MDGVMLLAIRCPGCSRLTSGPCAACWSAAGPPPRSSVVPAAVSYQGVGRRLLLGLKYGNCRTLAEPLAIRMARLVEPGAVDIVTWAPTSPRRTRRRGFDQAELLAQAVASELGVPCRRLLRRVSRSRPQTGRNRAERRVGPSFVGRRQWGAVTILVVDDVVTTGATLRAAERALLRAGAAQVLMLAGAATP